MNLPVGAKVKFASERGRYTVQASDERYAVCTKPFNAQRTVLYTVVDQVEGVRGTENLIFGEGAETREQCADMLDRLNGRPDSNGRFLAEHGHAFDGLRTEVSHRNRIALDIERVDLPRAA